MDVNSIIVDNFLDNPDTVRDSALSAEFPNTGNFPGFRSNASDAGYRSYVKEKLEKIINSEIEWNSEESTKFQICFDKHTSWIHHDPDEWTGILYLTPNAIPESGTAIYRHKDSNAYSYNTTDHTLDTDLEAWEIITFIGNVYNRLALFKGNSYHRSGVAGFGHDKHSARLTQTFFFKTKPKE